MSIQKPNQRPQHNQYDYVIIGSGFGGSVSALRLAEKGYSVLVLEKGRWYSGTAFANSTSHFKEWLWNPAAGLRGIMKMTFFKHATILSGVGVGGGSLVYGATLPTPKPAFFESGSWANLNDWQSKLAPHYDTALKMLGAVTNPTVSPADKVIKELAVEIGREEHYGPARVGIFFGDRSGEETSQAGKLVDDPYFDGKGPQRRGCIECGQCMTGCRHDAKNSLDKNYLYLAQQLGVEIVSDTEVDEVKPFGAPDGSQGYFVSALGHKSLRKNRRSTIHAKNVIFAGGVTGTVPLMMTLKAKGALPGLSPRLGDDIRTNNEAFASVTALDSDEDYSHGICIGSIVNTDEDSHLEPIHYGKRSGEWRFMMTPYVSGATLGQRLIAIGRELIRAPRDNLRVLFAKNWGSRTIYLLFMQHLDSTLSLKVGRFGKVQSYLPKDSNNPAPTSDIPAATDITHRVARIMKGKATRGTQEVILGSPTTAHVLGGAVMGANEQEGVVDEYGRVYGYKNMLVCDGSIVSANPGVNPSLTITAITEHNMTAVAQKTQQPQPRKKPSNKSVKLKVA